MRTASESASPSAKFSEAPAGATVYIALVAACAALLHRHTGQQSVVLGSPMGMREQPELEAMPGPFVSLLMLRIDFSDDPSWRTLLARARDMMLDAHAHRHVPFEALVERLKPARSLAHAPLFQVALVQHNTPAASAASIDSGGAMHELTWFLREAGGRLEGAIEYRSDLYSRAAVQRLASQLEALLAAARPRRATARR